jgi:hypothetical protein
MRSTKIASLTFPLLLLIIFACQDSSKPSSTQIPSGLFAYTEYDLNGNVTLAGTMTLHRQADQITGNRNLKDTNGVVDSGAIGGTVKPDGSFEIVFDPTKVLYAYVSIKGNEWPTSTALTGDVFSSSGTADWQRKIGKYKLSPVN